MKQYDRPIAINANGVALTSNSEKPYREEIGDIKKVYKEYTGSYPNIEKIIDPENNVNEIAISGVKKFIKFEGWDLETIEGKKLFTFTTHQ